MATELENDNLRFRLYGGKDPRTLPAYPLELAARILLIPRSTLRVWVFGAEWTEKSGQKRSFEPLIIPPDRRKTLLSFVNLVEAHVLKTIRHKHRIQMIHVREAISELSKTYNTEYPLADVDLLAGDAELFYKRFGILLNLSRGKQQAFSFLQTYLDRIERNLEKQAKRLYPFVIAPVWVGRKTLINQDPKLISIDPYISYGRPVITGTGISTDAIADRFWGGDNIELLARDFDCSISAIEYAIRYEKAQAHPSL
jgi:uncharacterized protein (DUF433 family)